MPFHLNVYSNDVHSDHPTYAICIDAGPWSELASRIQQLCRPTKLIVATDQNVDSLHAGALSAALAGLGVPVIRLVCPPGEASKCMSVANAWWEQLAAAAVDRRSVMVAVGGGVVGDLAGFVAATYLRGLTLVQVPTTLLAQVDSSVGGKVAINLPAGKNLVGCFWQPSLVWIDPQVLSTLSPREFAAGMAEVIKYAVIRDSGLLPLLESQVSEITGRTPDVLASLIHNCCEIKAQVVAEDPRETTGIRAILNFGHTIGHAIENLTGYDTVLHGEAVAMGMVAEAQLAERIGWSPPGLTSRLERLLRQYELPTQLPKFSWNQWQDAMLRDKKNVGQKIAFALPRGVGAVHLTHEVPLDDVQAIVGVSC